MEVRPGKGAERLRIEQEIKHVVVPDYFADDVVVSAGSSGRSRVGLPAENCLVNLTGEGDAITACVWKYGQADADAIMEGTESGIIPGRRDRLRARGRAFGLPFWKGRASGTAGGLRRARPARWNWHGDGLSRRSGDATWSARRACAFEQFRGCPRRKRGCGAVLVRSGAGVRAASRTVAGGGERDSLSRRETTLVVYPIDRSPATPLTAFCVNDVMRSALGTGPCQYVLEAEGMGTEYPATPDLVSRWLEEQFRKGKLKKESAALRERLDQMARHVEEVQGRIRDYGKLADKIQSACADPGPNGPLAQEVLKLLEEMRRAVADDEDIRRSAEQVTQEVLALAEKEVGADEWQAEMGKVRALGATQDGSLARCRMILRQVIQLCRGAQGTAADFADRVKKLAQSGLRKEAPIHEERGNGSE